MNFQSRMDGPPQPGSGAAAGRRPWIPTAIVATVASAITALATSLLVARTNGGIGGPRRPGVPPLPETRFPSAPAGTILPFGGIPDRESLRKQGWLPCDGAAYRTNEFANLFAAIRYSWGTGEADGEFRVPDLRGLFLRGVDGDAGRDPDKEERTAPAPNGNTGNRVGSHQADALGRHAHPVSIAVTGDEAGGQIGGGTYTRGGNLTDTASQGGSETRPKNAYVHYLIKL
ncbi:MAG: tail fiber protein [Verrucomicrobia bacterium]|nr:MAG: tail fiber protein [Verrucomicrobiota bacterium]